MFRIRGTGHLLNLTIEGKQRSSGELAGSSRRKRGPQRREENPLAEKVGELERENARLNRRVQRAEGIMEPQNNLGDLADRAGKERRERLIAMMDEH